MITLTKRQYIGEGEVRVFENNHTGEQLVISITTEEYQQKEVSCPMGFKLLYSASGVVKLDTEKILPQIGDWWEVDGQNYVCIENELGLPSYKKVKAEDIVDSTIEDKIYG